MGDGKPTFNVMMAAMPFESPKLSAMAVIERADFATVLESVRTL